MVSYKSYQECTRSGGSSSSTDTNCSERSKSTAPTVVSDRTTSTFQRTEWPNFYKDDSGPRASTSTYASTTGSTADLAPEEPKYEVIDREEAFPTEALASTPSSFAGLFPSSRRLLIRHDDTTRDGNMNLRVDTVVPSRSGYQQDVILFHLRMYDLFLRKFSLRRYCRDSGREVCHSSRKEVSNRPARPVFRGSWSSMLANLRPASSGLASSLPEGLKRQNSGFETERYENINSSVEEPVERGPALPDAIMLEFSNYAHVELRRTAAKRYEYEYWSTKYQWRREDHNEGDLREVSYYLVDLRTSRTIAHLVPDILTPLEAVEEESKGGWVPPCSLWISDPSVYERMADAADVIVATGLVTLVDDCIRRRWHHERRRPWILPAGSSFTKSLERLGPRRLIGEVLHRRGSA